MFYKFVLKKFTFGKISSGGRNFYGRICVFHRGGGNKRKQYLIDLFRRVNQKGVILKIISSPNYSAFLGLVYYANAYFRLLF